MTIIDNEPLICRSPTMGLRLAGFDAVAVSNPRNAVAMAATAPAAKRIAIETVAH